MATNPLKILTYLTASKDARFEETVNISGAVTAQNGVTVSGGNLTVSAGNISGSGTLQAGGAATLANGATLTGGNLAVNAGSISGSGTLQAGGAATLANGVTVTGSPVNASTVAVSASALNVTNTASVGTLSVVGNAVVGGNLTVQGTLTSIESTTVNVGDFNLNLGTGSSNLATLSGGGIDLGTSAQVQWRYDNANTSWTSNVDINVATDSESYKITGTDVLTKTGAVLEVGAGAAIDVIKVANGNVLAASGTLRLSGSSDFTYITGTVRTDGLYDVDVAIHELDTKLSASATANTAGLTTLKAQYNKLRTVVTGTLSAPGPNAGQATIILTTYDATEFAIGQIDNIALDILIDANNTGRYTNDLVAMELYTSGSDLKVQIDAPAAASGKYRLIAVNERDGGLG